MKAVSPASADAFALIKLAQDDGKYEARIKLLTDLESNITTKLTETRLGTRAAKQDREAAETALAEASRIAAATAAAHSRRDEEHEQRAARVKAREDDVSRRESELAGQVTQRSAELDGREQSVKAAEAASAARARQTEADAAAATAARAKWERLLAAAQALVASAETA